jgi:hypothetical protein
VPNALILKTQLWGICKLLPFPDTKGLTKNSSPLTVPTTPLNSPLKGSVLFPGIPTPVPTITSTKSFSLNFIPLHTAKTPAPITSSILALIPHLHIEIATKTKIKK